MNVLVIGASLKPYRVSYQAIERLRRAQHNVLAIGVREGQVADVLISKMMTPLNDIHTITLYINPSIQPAYYDYIISLNPKRVIFNPGTENPDLVAKLNQAGIPSEDSCTLVMLGTGQF